MAADEHTDLYLKFVVAGSAPDGEAIETETRTELVSSTPTPDPLLKGFKAKHFMEVDSFSFGIGRPRPTTAEKNKPATVVVTPNQAQGGRPVTQTVTITSRREPEGTEEDSNHVDPQPVTFQRSIDTASHILMDHLLNRKIFEHATIIKRKSVGGPGAGEVFLRLDFTKVLIKHIGWADGLDVKEDVQFIYRSVTIHYRPQLPDGTLGGALQGFWKALGSQAKPVILR